MRAQTRKLRVGLKASGLGLVALFVLLGLRPTPANPGVVFEVETTYHSGSSPRVETAEMSVEGEMLKMEIPPSADTGGNSKDQVIFRGDRREMIVVDHEEQSYMVFNEAMIEDMGRQLGEAQAALQGLQIPQAVLDQMPEAERKRIEAMLNQQGAGGVAGVMPGGAGPSASTTEYRRTSERATREGYPCVKYETLRDGIVVQELWVTDWDNVDGGDEAERAFAALASFFEEMRDAMGDMMGGAGAIFGGQDPFSGFTEMGGIPVVSRRFQDGGLESEAVLRSAQRQQLDPAAFEPPSGYRRMSMGPR